MGTGKLTKNQGNNKDWTLKIGLKSRPINWDNIPPEWDGRVVEFENDKNGSFYKLISEGTTIINPNTKRGATTNVTSTIKKEGRDQGTFGRDPKKSNRHHLKQNQNHYNMPQNKMPSNAPYNFVPLNKEPIASKEPYSDRSKFEGKSGYIDLDITSLTHIFIKGTDYDFFKVGRKYGIPGSSIRGMIRNLVEILSYGKFEHFNDKHISYRISGQVGDRLFGFLTYKSQNNKYYVTAGYKPTAVDHKDQFKYELNSSGQLEIHTKGVGKNHRFFRVQYATNGSQSIPVSEMAIKSYNDDTQRNAEEPMKDLIQLVQNENNIFVKKCREHNLKYIGIPVFYKLNDSSDEVTSFGHCKNYRVPYANTVADAVYEKLKESGVIDIASSIFGHSMNDGKNTTLTPGKVFFEDAVTDATETKQAILQILASPKPKSGKLYLEPKANGDTGTWGDNPTIRGYKLYHHRDTDKHPDKTKDSLKREQINWQKTRFSNNHFNNFNLSDQEKNHFRTSQMSDIKNNVFHFTKKLSDLSDNSALQIKIKDETNNTPNSQFKTVNTLPPDTKFKSGRIRFEHLTEIELGALLLAINLPVDCRHKIGMGKPIGMGSICITSSLTLIDRKNRYTELFSENMASWHTGTSIGDVYTFIKAFTDYICEQVSPDLDFWSIDRMKELYTMLRYDKSAVQSESYLRVTNYMHLDDFKYRVNLPKASDVKKKYFDSK